MFLGPCQTTNRPKWEAIPSSGMITLRERKDALCDLFLARQEGTKFSSTKTDRLDVFKEQVLDSSSAEEGCRALKQTTLPSLSCLVTCGHLYC